VKFPGNIAHVFQTGGFLPRRRPLSEHFTRICLDFNRTVSKKLCHETDALFLAARPDTDYLAVRDGLRIFKVVGRPMVSAM
jgi:hypothetical protein